MMDDQVYNNNGGGNNNNMFRIPNRIFVGGIPQTASQDELRDYFAHFGPIKDARIISDPRGNSKGYGFVTYESENDASKVLGVKEEELVFKESKLNIGHAFRKKNNNGGGGFGGGGHHHHQQQHHHQNHYGGGGGGGNYHHQQQQQQQQHHYGNNQQQQQHHQQQQGGMGGAGYMDQGGMMGMAPHHLGMGTIGSMNMN